MEENHRNYGINLLEILSLDVGLADAANAQS